MSLLKQIENEVLAHEDSEREYIVIFDLDSTLFNVTGRNQAILQAAAEFPDFQKRFPKESKLLQNIKAIDSDWGIGSILERSGISGSLDFFQSIRKHWHSYFFSNDYLHFDRPYPGAVEYVQRLHQKGASIYYLTARDRPRMETGTIASLKKYQLPYEEHRLMMKSETSRQDEDFKVDVLRAEFPKERTSHIWFFDNEPLIINSVHKHLPHIQLVFVDTVHSGRAIPPEKIHRVSSIDFSPLQKK